MATYYVRIGGNDASAGTSAGAAWRTIGKALGATGIASGDTVYIGSGIYMELVTVAMTSATVETQIIGDITGEFTGDAPGEVWWIGQSGSGLQETMTFKAVDLAGRDFLTFRNLRISGFGTGATFDASITPTSTNIKLSNCLIECYGGNPVMATNTFGVAFVWLIEKCMFIQKNSTGSCVELLVLTGTGSNYDIDFTVNDSILLSFNGIGARVGGSGASANEGNGLDLARCTVWASSGLQTIGTNLNLSAPSTAIDCLFLCSTNLNAGESGAITDLGGNIGQGSYTNVTQHNSSRTSTSDLPFFALSWGHEWMWGMPPRQFLSPSTFAYGRGHIGSATTDMTGKTRGEGSGRFIDSGTATSGAATTITDSGKSWKTDEHKGRLVRLTGGTGSGQVKHIASNTATALTIGTISGDWATNPDSTSTYIIYEGPSVETGKATSGAANTLTDANAAWSVNKWGGYTVAITGGTGSGQSRTITTNTATALTISSSWSTNPDSTSTYSIYWPGGSLTANGKFPGALDMHDTAVKETAVTDAGSVGICLYGPASQEFLIPVDAVSTTISIKMRYDSNHGTTNKPRAILLANGEIAVSTETKTMTSAADTWETLTFTAFTPSAKGVVTVRLESRSDTPYGRAYADTWTVT